ncbi:hypothetical protein ACFL0V_02295 [Nanoarchaeota archaeon]
MLGKKSQIHLDLTGMEQILKLLILGGFFGVYWLVVLVGLLKWYRAEFYVLAVVGSLVMVVLGKSWGLVEKFW